MYVLKSNIQSIKKKEEREGGTRFYMKVNVKTAERQSEISS